MGNRDHLIQKRANEIFDRENKNSELTLDVIMVQVTPGRKTKAAISEGYKQRFYDRAEQELIKEGVISAV